MSFEPNEMMMDLFRSEVEVHSDALTTSLLALERDPSASNTLDRMMRAAHSIKGAARIVRVDPAVDVAHAMEDCFVAAQQGKLKLTSDDVDILLRGVDILVKISAATKDSQTDWRGFESSVQGMVVELKGVLQGQSFTPASKGLTPESEPAIAPERAPAPATQAVQSESARPASSTVIKIPDILDAAAAELARHELLSALEAGSLEIRLDLSATRDLDVTGLAFLAAARQHISALPRAAIRFHPVSADMRTVLQVTGLDAPARETLAL